MRGSYVALVTLALGSSAACGGKVDEPSPSTTTGSNAPTNAPAAGTGCERACKRLDDCTALQDDACVRSCSHELSDPVSARIYGSCIESLSCATIQEGLSMDFGPIGACYAKAQQH